MTINYILPGSVKTALKPGKGALRAVSTIEECECRTKLVGTPSVARSRDPVFCLPYV